MTGARRITLAGLCALLLLAGPLACGKRGSLEAPEGREAEFTYPQPYPAPSGVLRKSGRTGEEATAEEEEGLRPRTSSFSVFPDREDETKVYGPVTAE